MEINFLKLLNYKKEKLWVVCIKAFIIRKYHGKSINKDFYSAFTFIIFVFDIRTVNCTQSSFLPNRTHSV